MTKLVKKLTAFAVASIVSASLIVAVNAYSYSDSKSAQIIDDIYMYYSIAVNDHVASGTTEVNDEDVLVSVNISATYELNGTRRTINDGNGSPDSFATISISNGSGEWINVTTTSSATYFVGETITKSLTFNHS